MRRTLLALPLLLLSAGPVLGQSALQCPTPPDSTQLDRVIAVVGDSVVLFTDLHQECVLAQQRNQQLVQDGQPPLQLTVELLLENLVNIQVLLQHAARDSTVLPTEEDVTGRVQTQMDSVRTRFATEAAFQQALSQEGLTLATYRERLRSQIRTGLIRDAYTRRLLQTAPTVVVSDAEMRAFYESRRGELQQLPELLTVQQVLIRSGASDEAWARTLQKADSLYALIVRGADFEALAREHSQDPGSAQQGGDLGWQSRGTLVPEFERAAFALRDGTVSVPVRSEYGYHVIKVERSRPGEKRIRHILVQPEVVASDLERTRALAQDVATRIRNGESALALARQYGDPTIPREIQVARGQEAEALPAELAQRLVGTGEGEVIGPFDVSTGGVDYVVVMHVTEVRAAGEFTFEDLRDRIRTMLTQQKREERIYQDLREKTYVEVRFEP